MLLAGGIYLLTTNKKSSPTKQKPAPSLSKEEQAISRAQNYLLNNFKLIDPNNRLVLDYMYRKFAISEQFSGQKETITYSGKDPQAKLGFDAVKRIAYPKKIVASLGLPADDSSGYMLLAAANCDHIPLPADFSAALQKNIDRGEYDLTHVVLMLSFMQDNGCSMPPDALIMTGQLLNKMSAMIENKQTIPDLRYECIAFLLFMDRADLVQKSWIDQVISEQLTDGGWGARSEDTKATDHSTVLALWALLEYARPNTPNEPLIRHPTTQL